MIFFTFYHASRPEEFGNFGMDNTSAEDRDVALGKLFPLVLDTFCSKKVFLTHILGFGPSGSVPGARRRRQSGSCFRFNAAVDTYQVLTHVQCVYTCGF